MQGLRRRGNERHNDGEKEGKEDKVRGWEKGKGKDAGVREGGEVDR